MKNNKGFTLVEILAVLVLISLMMVIIVPSVQKVALNSKIKLCNSKINLAEESINLWARDNYKCFEKTDGCNILSNCQKNNDIIKCESTFKTLAENNLLNYDKNVKNINYVVNPINNGNMNDTKIYIEFNSKNKQVKSYVDKSNEVCSKNASAYNDHIDEETETTTPSQVTKTPVVNFLENLYNKDASSNGLEKDDTTDENIRYVGASPKNYLTFNDETWRIIGIFNVYNVETGRYEKLTKIIRNSKLGTAYSWDSSESTINSGYGINEWSQADLMYELNCDGKSTKYCRDDITEGYLSNLTSGTTLWYNSRNNGKDGSYDYSNNIKNTSLDKIATIRWNLGGYSTYEVSTLNMYNAERGTTQVSNPADGIERKSIWEGKIALIYPSDYGYASTDSTCRNNLNKCDTNSATNNWLFNGESQRTLTPYNGYANNVFRVTSTGMVDYYGASSNLGVRPTLFLKSDVMISGGTGTESDPYKILIEEKETPTTFENDSWETISKVVKSGKGESYPIGATKEVEIAGTNYTVRVANNTTPEECTREDFSQTACGFVVEFTEVVAKRNINPSKPGTQFQYGWNVDGWPASDMRINYANSEFFNSLPDDLKNVIIETKAISGHGSTAGETNFISTDEKIYLLSPHEVYEDGTSNKVSTSDTAYSQTRQLDYYKSKGVTTTNYASAAKKYGTETSRWWLRSARKDTNVYFISVTEDGKWGSNGASGNYGFSPAFRIG